jgi:hypothetical protein
VQQKQRLLALLLRRRTPQKSWLKVKTWDQRLERSDRRHRRGRASLGWLRRHSIIGRQILGDA